jgi:hypothetical protein
MAIELIRAGHVDLDAAPLGAGYSGPETYRDLTAFTSSDGVLSIGVWSYEGVLQSSNPGATHQLWFLLSGEAKITMDDNTVHASAGDVVAFEAPYPAKTVEASADFRAVWVAVKREEIAG